MSFIARHHPVTHCQLSHDEQTEVAWCYKPHFQREFGFTVSAVRGGQYTQFHYVKTLGSSWSRHFQGNMLISDEDAHGDKTVNVAALSLLGCLHATLVHCYENPNVLEWADEMAMMKPMIVGVFFPSIHPSIYPPRRLAYLNRYRDLSISSRSWNSYPSGWHTLACNSSTSFLSLRQPTYWTNFSVVTMLSIANAALSCGCVLCISLAATIVLSSLMSPFSSVIKYIYFKSYPYESFATILSIYLSIKS